MKLTKKIELTEKQCVTLSVALHFATEYVENSIHRSDNPDFRDEFFGILVDLYNFEDYLYPDTRESREKYRMKRNGGEADEK